MAGHGVGPIFISHAHSDVLSARRLKAGLASGGYECWLAPDDMIGRDSWAGELLQQIDRCLAFVVLVSPATLESKHVHRELTLAVEHDKDVIPVLLEPVTLGGPLAYLLSTRHWIEADRVSPDAVVDAIVRRVVSEEAQTGASPGARISEATARGKVAWGASRVPVPLDPIIGRESLVESVVDAIRSGSRLVTLRGPGGVGKTRLALAVAQKVAEEGIASVSFADLSEALDATSLMVGIANALGYAGPSPEEPREVAATFQGDLKLLVCDNLEQVAMHAAPLQQLLQAAPALIVLVTSRKRLGLAGESVVVVPPLEVPPEFGHDGAGPFPAVEVFLQAARHAVPGYAPTPAELLDVERLCRALDGLPLALELAASRLAMMSPAQLWERVGRPLASHPAATSSSDRQASVEATIAWSLSLLSQQALAGFPRLGVFQGGFTLDAAEQVCSSAAESEAEVDDWLSELVDASLVMTADAPSGRRFFLLQLLLAESRRRSPAGALEEGHATYFAELAERRRADIIGPRGAAVTRELIDELPNWSRALSWAARHDPHLYCRLARGWRAVWTVSPRPADVLGNPLSADERESLSEAEVATLEVLSAIAAYLASAAGSKPALERAVLHESVLKSDPDLVVLAWSFLGAACVQAGNLDDARDAAARARGYAIDHGGIHDEAVACDISAWVASSRGDLAEGRGFVERSIALAERQHDDVGVCFGLSTLGGLLIEEGDSRATRACADRLLEIVEQGRGLAYNETQGLRLLGIADVMDGDLAGAAQRIRRALREEEALPIDVVGNLITAAAVLAAVGDLDAGSRTLAQAQRLGTKFELELQDIATPLLDHLAKLHPEAARLDELDESSLRTVRDEVVAGLARIAGDGADRRD